MPAYVATYRPTCERGYRGTGRREAIQGESGGFDLKRRHVDAQHDHLKLLSAAGRARLVEQAGGVSLPVSDDVVTIRSFIPGDRPALLQGRDSEWERWLGPGSPDPTPTACIEVNGVVVGWIDVDSDATWLEPGEVNVGYSVFPEHRGNGYAARALRLLASGLSESAASRALLVIDEHNAASHRVATAAGARVIADRRIPQFPSSVVYGIELVRATQCWQPADRPG